MKKTILLLFILIGIRSFSQEVNKKQQEVATKFIEYVTNGKAEKSWKLFDKKNNPDLSKEKFTKFVKIISKNFERFDKYDLILVGKKYFQGKTLDMYTFKATSTKERIITDIQIEVLFFEKSNLVAGFQPKQRINNTKASTSGVTEIEVAKSFEAKIENKIYKIIGINIVPFAEKKGLLVIQVEYILPENTKKDDKKMHKNAIKFAKFMIQNDYISKAKSIAKKNGLTLKSELGVSFFNSKIGAGYNVMLDESECK